MLALAVGLLVAILGVAVQATRAATGPGGRAAELVPASALAFARLSTDPDDPAARDLARLAPKLPGYARLHDEALRRDLTRCRVPSTCGATSAPGWVTRRPSRSSTSAGRLGSARWWVGRRSAIARAPRRCFNGVAGARPAARYAASTVIRRFGDNAAAFVKGLSSSPAPNWPSSAPIDASRGDTPALADAPAFERAGRAAPGARRFFLPVRATLASAVPDGGVVGWDRRAARPAPAWRALGADGGGRPARAARPRAQRRRPPRRAWISGAALAAPRARWGRSAMLGRPGMPRRSSPAVEKGRRHGDGRVGPGQAHRAAPALDRRRRPDPRC